jgi:Rieske Fe-S protein
VHAAVALAASGLLGASIARDEVHRTSNRIQDLVSGPGRWYDIAAFAAVADGQVQGFTAGGVLGYIIKEGRRLTAVSALCTHMGCRLKPTQTPLGFRCLCHDAHFSAAGAVLSGPATEPLPHIALRVIGGRIYARGTIEEALGSAGAGLPPKPTGEKGKLLLINDGSPVVPEHTAGGG